MSLLKNLIAPDFEPITHGAIGILCGLSVTTIFLRIDRRSFSSINFFLTKKTLPHFLIGLGIGVVLMGLIAFCVLQASGLSIQLKPTWSLSGFILATLPLLPLAFMEEIAFRGYPFVIIQERSGNMVAVVVTSILFGLYHIANGWPVMMALVGTGCWGIVYGAAAVFSKGIAIPTGLHFAANLTTAAMGAKTGWPSIWTVSPQPEAFRDDPLISLFIPAIFLAGVGIFSLRWLQRRQRMNS